MVFLQAAMILDENLMWVPARKNDGPPLLMLRQKTFLNIGHNDLSTK